MIPSVRYGAWAPYPGRPGGRGLLVRFLTCSGCGAILARQFTDDPNDPPSVGWPYPLGPASLRSEMILLPRLSPRGVPVYGQQSAYRRGRRPHTDRRREQVIELRAPVIDPATGQTMLSDVDRERLERLGRPPRTTVHGARRRMRPAADEWLPGDPPIWFNRDARLPCEVYCLGCGRLHLVMGHGPEGAAQDELNAVAPDDPAPGSRNRDGHSA